MMVWIEHINSRSGAAGTYFIAWAAVITNGMKRVAVWNEVFFYPLKRGVEIRSRHRKRIVLVAFCSPRCQLQSKFFINTNYCERAVLAFVSEAENVCVEINARRKIVGVEDNVVDRRHLGTKTRLASSASYPKRIAIAKVLIDDLFNSRLLL